MRVALFIPCFIDQLFPQVGIAMVNVLRRLKVEVDYPAAQTCCGQPAFNTGYWDEARELAQRYCEILAGYDAIVSPSGSCTAMVRNFYPELLGIKAEATKGCHSEPAPQAPRPPTQSPVAFGAGEEPLNVRSRAGIGFAALPLRGLRASAHSAQGDKLRSDVAARVCANTFEFSEFLVRKLGVTDVGARFPARVTYHDSCHALRELRLKDEPRQLLRNVQGLELIEMDKAESCCGFGGTFAVKFPMISYAMDEVKCQSIAATGAQYVVSADASCLMQIDGYLRRLNLPTRTISLAEVLACQ